MTDAIETPAEAPADEGRAPLRRLWFYARQHLPLLITGGTLAFLGGLIGLVQPIVAMDVIESLETGESLRNPLLILVAAVLVGGALEAFGPYLMQRTGQDIVLTVRRRLVGSLVRLTIAEVDRLKPGDLVSRLTSDTNLLRTVASTTVIGGTTAVFMLLGGIALMAWIDLVLFGTTMAMIVLVSIIMTLIMPRIRNATTASQAALGEMGSILERIFSAFRTVKASGAEDIEIGKLDVAAREARDKGVMVAVWEALAGVMAWLPVNVAFLIVLGVGGARVAAGTMTISSLIGFLLLLFYLMGPISSLVAALSQLQTGLAAIRRVETVADLAHEQPSNGASISANNGPALLSFDNVTFGYGPGLPQVHHGVSFEASGTGLTALVGPSGAGKTTVFSLIERFYPVTSGEVRVDGTRVEDWPLAALRGMIGYVEQDAPVLHGTLRENLLMAAPDATEAELAEIVKRARLTELVASLPDGLDSAIGYRGMTLSGGERQRVAIARALLRKPRLLLLDEATSQLDAANEAALKQTMLDAADRTNVIVVAHRLSTVTSANQIVVLDAGRVRAVGSHTELVATDELYRDLAASQLLTADSH
ncbi:ABC transporter ATP-binding protein [Stackebrandtia nassauensis]|uniref:ABC transporter related protein n=1 Tax=Stackebrandtia nassauensis (strain DSM 44728 / CIP 108903 / NRRL B-16338 / NBRC 102104 / LLR-40K-21) TaxID=446470 RepID=D3Q0T9_STANL|nr:ABC transporter transmembrane domain-containing protein [Stackebrandtia nassauensis]ADD43689.1 ABC transporter related protein [Stackebrandtia nassauensis DSM 44728]